MKILYVNYVMEQGGIENFIMNVTRKLCNENKIEILTFINSEKKFYHEEELQKMNCKIHKIDKKKISLFNFEKKLIKLFKNEKYDIVHSNTYVASGYIMLAAFLSGVKIRVAHSHSSYESETKKQKIKGFLGRKLVKYFSNRKIACGEKAGKKLFGNTKFEILENGVDLNKYKYNEDTRKIIRKKFNINDKEKVIGHVGRFHKVKNHKFIIEIFEKIIKEEENYKLMLVGDGEELTNIKEIIEQKRLTSKVIFVGSVNDASEYYNAFDCILFPSFFEGLPFVFVEGQINGLNIIASDKISRDSNLIGNVTFLSIDEDINKWVSIIKEKSSYRHFEKEYFKTSNYNLENTVNKLLNIYEKNK